MLRWSDGGRAPGRGAMGPRGRGVRRRCRGIGCGDLFIYVRGVPINAKRHPNGQRDQDITRRPRQGEMYT